MQFDTSEKRSYNFDELGLYTSYALLAANIEATGYSVEYTGIKSDVKPDDTINSPEVLSESMMSRMSGPLPAIESSSVSYSQSQDNTNPLRSENRKDSGISNMSSLSMDLENPSFDKGDFKPSFTKQDSTGSVKFQTIYEGSEGSFDGSKSFVEKKKDLTATSVDYSISGAQPGGKGATDTPPRKNSIAERAALLGGKLGSTSQQSMVSEQSDGGAARGTGTNETPPRKNSIAERASALGGKLGSTSQHSLTNEQSDGGASTATKRKAPVRKNSIAERAALLGGKLGSASTSQQSINALEDKGGKSDSASTGQKVSSIQERAAKLNDPGK